VPKKEEDSRNSVIAHMKLIYESDTIKFVFWALHEDG